MISKAAQTKQFIIERAAPIFNKKGYAATSMNDILQATGLAKGGIYGNFLNKDELAISVFEFANQQLITAITGKIKSEKTAIGKLTAILNFYHNYTLHPLMEGGCPLLNTAIDSDYNFPVLKQKVAAAYKQMLNSLVYIIQKGIDTDEFKPVLNAQTEAALIFAVIEGGMMMSRLQDDPAQLNKLLTYLKNHVLTYLK